MKRILGTVLFSALLAGVMVYGQAVSAAENKAYAKGESTETKKMSAAGYVKGGSTETRKAVASEVAQLTPGTTDQSMLEGMTDEAALEISHDQKDKFVDAMQTKLKSLNMRIDQVRETSKLAPQGINDELRKDTDRLYGMSGESQRKIDTAKDAASRENWDDAKFQTIDSLNKLEQELMSVEKKIQ